MKDYAPLYNRRTGGRHYADSKRRADMTRAVVLALFIGSVFGVWVSGVVA